MSFFNTILSLSWQDETILLLLSPSYIALHVLLLSLTFCSFSSSLFLNYYKRILFIYFLSTVEQIQTSPLFFSLLPPMLKQPFNHHKFTKHHTLTTILKPTIKAHLLTHQSHTCPQMITSPILNPPNLIPTLAHTHNCLLDRQTIVR